MERDERLLLIDTCGETAGVALSAGERVIAREDLARGDASAEIVKAVLRLLERAGWKLGDLDAVGVVNGPGSFTGVRVGVAAAKGLCEAAGLSLVAISRLQVLADAARLSDGFAVLDAGRGEMYVRDVIRELEWLSLDGFEAVGKKIAIAETRLAERLQGSTLIERPLCVEDAVGVVLGRLRSGEPLVNAEVVDANYVRGESDIYSKQVKV